MIVLSSLSVSFHLAALPKGEPSRSAPISAPFPLRERRRTNRAGEGLFDPELRPSRARMGMGDRAGNRVGGVVRLGDFLEPQQHAHHHLNLMLVCAAVADDRLLDLHRRILKQLIRIFLAGDERHAARAADLYAGRHVFGEKQLLQRDHIFDQGDNDGEEPRDR